MGTPKGVTTVRIGTEFALQLNPDYAHSRAVAESLARFDRDGDGVLSEGDFDGRSKAVATYTAAAIDPEDLSLPAKIWHLAQVINHAAAVEPALTLIRSRFREGYQLFNNKHCEISSATEQALGGPQGLSALEASLAGYYIESRQMRELFTGEYTFHDTCAWGYGVFFPMVERVRAFNNNWNDLLNNFCKSIGTDGGYHVSLRDPKAVRYLGKL